MESSKKALTGVKKRQQIKDANKMTFIWITVASAAIIFCLVTSQFLVRQFLFNQKVINARSETQSVLAGNLKKYDALKQSVEKLSANPDLPKVKANLSDSVYKVVLDALPATNDGTVLGSSLLQVIIPKSGVSVENLTAGYDQTNGDVAEGENKIPFSLTVNSNYSQTLTMLKDIERSIRPINVTELTLEGSDKTLNVKVNGESYFAPEKTIQLGKKVEKP